MLSDGTLATGRHFRFAHLIWIMPRQNLCAYLALDLGKAIGQCVLSLWWCDWYQCWYASVQPHHFALFRGSSGECRIKYLEMLCDHTLGHDGVVMWTGAEILNWDRAQVGVVR